MNGDGEKLHSAQRRRFWGILGALAVLGLVGGFIGILIIERDMGTVFTPQVTALAAAGVVILSILFAYGSWRFFRDVDELEQFDNLVGSTIGLYAYAIVFPAWWALYKLGYATEPHDWVIFNIALISAFAVYLYRKWQVR